MGGARLLIAGLAVVVATAPISRRTFVPRRIDGQRKTVHLHASGVIIPAGVKRPESDTRKSAMNKLTLGVGILCFVAAVIIFVFAEGMRRWYSGIFFAIIGAVILAQTLRARRAERSGGGAGDETGDHLS